MERFEGILQRSSVSFSIIDSLEQFPQWTALYRYRNDLNEHIYIHHSSLIAGLNWQSVSLALATGVHQSQVRVFHALMANRESGTLIFDYDIQQQLNQIDDNESTVVILDRQQLMDSMEFVVKQIDELNKDQKQRNICVIHPAELPLGTQLCLYRGV
ncbi:hypothetical protein [Colwellia sp. E150_009]|jgi:hypothetical protein